MKLSNIFRSKKASTQKRLFRAAVVEPLEERQLMSLTLQIETFAGGQTATVTKNGDVVNLALYAIVSGKTSGANDGFQSVSGSLISSLVNTGSVGGTLSAGLAPDYQAFGASNGTQQDLNGDGYIDVGSNDNADVAGFFNARAGGLEQDGVVSGDTQRFTIALMTYTVTNFNAGKTTDINFRFRNVQGSSFVALWEEDGVPYNDEDKGATLVVGAPLVINQGTVATTGSVSGTVFSSASGSTTGQSGVTVYADTNNNGKLDSGEPSVVTGSSGTYNLSSLNAGNYTLREVVPTGYTASSPASGSQSVTITAGGNLTGYNFTNAASTTTTGTKLTGSAIGTSGSYQNDGNTIAKALDGNLSTFFDGPTANGNTVGLDLGAPATITQIKYSSRSGWVSRMNGGYFQASNSSTFASGDVTLYTIPSNANPSSTALTTQNVSVGSTYRYVRYVSPSGSYGDVGEVQFYGTAGVAKTKLTGTTIGTSGSYQNNGNTIAKATDGNLSTYFDGPTANGNYVGLDLGSAKVIAQISYAPRSTYASRMVGGVFQASNSSSFSSPVTLYTVSATPAVGSLTTVSLTNSTAYRYVRYLSPTGSYGNVAEIQFFS